MNPIWIAKRKISYSKIKIPLKVRISNCKQIQRKKTKQTNKQTNKQTTTTTTTKKTTKKIQANKNKNKKTKTRPFY